MIFTKPRADLQQSIDKMGLPVFVIDQDKDGAFRLTALNRSHSLSTGLSLEAVANKTPEMILPKREDAEFLTGRYRVCVTERKPIMYSTRLTYRDDVKDIRTTLHPVSVDGQAPTRLVGEVTISVSMREHPPGAQFESQCVLARADIQAIEAILDNIRRCQTISSHDMMMLGNLTRNRSLSLSEVVRLVENFNRRRKAKLASETVEPAPDRGPLAELPATA